MALSFALLVCGAPYGTESAAQAYLFARELIVQGHTLKKVFFYQEGVLNANFLTSPASDEQNLVAAWVSLAREHAVELDVCVAAALRRGVLDGDEAHSAGLSVANVEAPFVLSGLGQLAEAALGVDRLVQF
ncbi:sulfurtransferase complex subunit TusD [Pseudaeromonas pectinilytica]|jgi:sulfur relay protein TusD/DsrE